jgi:microcin C transport system permease protein
MASYLLRRLLLMIPTLFGILMLNFIIIQAAPGGPVEQMIAKIRGTATDAASRIAGSGSDFSFGAGNAGAGLDGGHYSNAYGLDPELINRIEKLYGFDKPAHERFWLMIKNYLTFDLGDSYFKAKSVIGLIKEKLPVSLSLGLWSTLIIYLVSIPLGIRKAVKDGTPFDLWTSSIIIIGYAVPSFLFAILLIVFFAGGSYWSFFPLRDIVSEGWELMPWYKQISDYLWHMALPIFSMVISGFASLTLLTKNSFLEEINKQYVLTARAKGLDEKKVLYSHVFRNAMLIVIAGLPSALLGVLFTGSLLIEVIFSLDGLGLLSFESALNRDYPVVFGSLYIFTLLGLFMHIIGDFVYTLVDPRIDFDKRIGA